MNKKSIIGYSLVVLAIVLAVVLVSVSGSSAEGLFGKALWYLPYVAFVGGVRNLVKCGR